MSRKDELKMQMRQVKERPVEDMPDGFVARKLNTAGMRQAVLADGDTNDNIVRHSIYLDGERFFDDDEDLSTLGGKEYFSFRLAALQVNGYIKEAEDLTPLSKAETTSNSPVDSALPSADTH